MVIKRHMSAILALLVVLMSASCSGGPSADWVTGAGLYLSPDGAEPTSSYGWLDTFYLIVDLTNTPEDTEVQASWIAVDTNRAEPETVIKIDQQTALNSRLVFELKNEGNFWPVGAYQVNLYLNGKLIQEIKFEVHSTDIY